MKTKEIQAIITSANIGANIADNNLNVVIGEAARMECQQAINYIKSGQTEIAEAVNAGKNSFNANATEKTNTFNQNATDKSTAFNNNKNEKKGLIDAQVAVAEGAATTATTQAGLAKQWAVGVPSEPVGNSSKYWAQQSAAAAATVNDATLTIQKNGTAAGTFTANQATDATINIVVPTTAADVSALPASTKYGASLSLSINSTTFVITAQLKDQDGNNLGTAQTIDLPLESVVVNGSYDSANKKIVLTLQNGTTVDIPVADLISGLASDSAVVHLANNENITGTKTFVGQKKVGFKQSANTDKLGFTLYTNNGTEKGYLEYNPSNTVDSIPLMTLGNYASAAAGLTHVGFRKYSSISGASGAYNLLVPLISDARGPFNLTTTYTNFYMPLGFTDGNTTVTTPKSGLVDLSPIISGGGSVTMTYNSGTKTLTWS